MSYKFKPSLIPYLGKPVGLLVLSVGLFLFSQPDILTALLSTAIPITSMKTLPTFEWLFSMLSLASLLTGAIAGFSFLLAIAYRNANTYFLTSNAIVIRRSFISRIRREISYAKISDVAVEQTFLGRIFGYGDVIPVSISGFGVIAQERYAAERRLDQLDSVKDPYWVAQFIMERTVATPAPTET
jgi:uncharacterized membrane protein YdbT with pleckstrin-like domain